MKLKEIEKKYNIKPVVVRKWIQKGLLAPQLGYKIGMPYDIDEEAFLKVKKYYWDDRTRTTYKVGWNREVFKEIDTPEKAYWLGFILADGCLHLTNQKKTTGYFSIDIGGRDREHLEKFSLFVEAQQPIIQTTKHSITGNDLVHVQLGGKYVLEDLKRYGIRERKSGLEEWIDTPFPADFVRGYYDGDGYIKKDLHSIGLVGGYGILNSIQQYFLKELGVEPKTIGKHGKIFRIEYCAQKDKQMIAEHLWYPGCVSLDRKQKLADKIKKLS